MLPWKIKDKNCKSFAIYFFRYDWDRFCVGDTTPGGTRIPDGFVIPEKPSSNIKDKKNDN
jgi:hypothetical protein